MAGTKHRIILQDRDQRLLEQLEVLRVVDREQAKILAGFRSTTRANARLLALTRAGFLTRIQLAGNRAAYQRAATRGATNWKSGSKFDAIRFCEHQLAINEVYLTLSYRHIPATGVRCTAWRRFAEVLAPSCPIIPDAYFELATAAGVRPSFLELDLGTESGSVLRRKFQLYVQLAISGEFQRLFGHQQFRVLVITTTERRLQNLRSEAAKVTDKIFWLSTLPQTNPSGFWAPVWRRPTGDQLLPLV